MLPPVLGNVNRRFATPVIASIAVGLILIVATWVYLLSSSVANVFTQVIDVTGLLYASFYILTAFSAIVYYRRRVLSNAWDMLLVGILPLAAAGFLVWIVAESLAKRARVGDLVDRRHRRRRADPDVHRTFRAAVAVLPDRARERRQGRLRRIRNRLAASLERIPEYAAQGTRTHGGDGMHGAG